MFSSLFYQFPTWIGTVVLSGLQNLGIMTLLGLESFIWGLRSGIKIPNLGRCLLSVGVQSLPIVSFTALFTGMVLVVQVGNQFMNLGAENIIGGVVGLSLTREMSPLIVAFVLSARIGSSMAAEIGTMKVTEQIDAMQILGANPVRELVLPRILACMIFTPLLVIYSNAVGIFGGYIVAVYQIGVNPELFFQSLTQMVAPHDFWSGLIKSSGFGFLVAIIGCHKGLQTQGGAKGVGTATTESVVLMITSILVSNYFFSLAFFAWMKWNGYF
ncbi:MAG: ABC transporter permease [Candidatus Cloacimonetes bacterium]|nr:ABC transporter permease [Candidatus Cloacimonadota bacterium]